MMNRKAIFLSALCLVALASSNLVGCQGAKVVRPPPSFEGLQACLEPAAPSEDPQEKQRCVYLLEQFLKAEPDHPRADETSFRLGQLYLETGDFSAAYHLFRSFPEEHPKARRQAEARLYLGVALYFLDNPADSLDVLHALADDPKAAPWAEEIYRYIAENYVKLENLPSALTWYARCLESTAEEADQERLQDRVLEVMSVGWEPEALQAATELFPEGFFSEAIHLGVVATCVQRGQLRLAEDHLMRMSVQHPEDVFTPHIHALLDRMAAGGQTQDLYGRVFAPPDGQVRKVRRERPRCHAARGEGLPEPGGKRVLHTLAGPGHARGPRGGGGTGEGAGRGSERGGHRRAPAGKRCPGLRRGGTEARYPDDHAYPEGRSGSCGRLRLPERADDPAAGRHARGVRDGGNGLIELCRALPERRLRNAQPGSAREQGPRHGRRVRLCCPV